MVDSARAHMDRGWAVFPVKGKVPTTKNGFKDASTDHGAAEEWWGSNPHLGVAMATGTRSGVWVLDLDGDEGRQAFRVLQDQFGDVPLTVAAQTGNGVHLYFQMPETGDVRNSAGKVALGVDVRGTGGYVVLPPSPHPSGARYTWAEGRSPDDCSVMSAPAWLLDLVRTTRRAARASRLPADECIPQGRRNATLTSFAGTMRQRGMTRDAIRAALDAENQARCHPPLDAAEIDGIADSVSTYEPGPTDSMSVADLIRATGLHELDETPGGDAIETCLRALKKSLDGADALRRQTVRAEAIRVLGEKKVRGATKLVDAALGGQRERSDSGSDGHWRTYGDGVVDVVRTDDGLQWIVIDEAGVSLTDEISGRQKWPAHLIPWPTVPTATSVKEALAAGGAAPYAPLKRLIAERVVLPRPAHTWAALLTSWVLGTYLMDDLPYYPLILLEGPAERGKTRLAKALLYPAYRGVLTVSTSPAMLARDRAWHRVTLGLDVEDLPRVIERGDYLGDLLLGSFEQGAQVRRCTRPDAPPPEQAEALPSYGATIVLTNRPIRQGSPLASRCIRVPMPEAGGQIVPDALKPGEAMEYRAQAAAWAALVRASSTPLPDVSVALRGRSRDLALPLLRVLALVAPEDVSSVSDLLLGLERNARAETARSWEARVAVALWDARDLVAGGRLYIRELTAVVNEGVDEADKLTAQQVGLARRQLGLDGGTGGRDKRAYVCWPGNGAAQALRERYETPEGPNRPPHPPASPADGVSDSFTTGAMDGRNGRFAGEAACPEDPMGKRDTGDTGGTGDYGRGVQPTPDFDLWTGAPPAPDGGSAEPIERQGVDL